MPQRLPLASVLVVVSIVTTTTVGCNGDDDADGTDSYAVSSAPGTANQFDVGTETYLIEPGDAVSGIADRYCVTGADLAEANGWSDGVGHLIRPGDTIRVPADACGSAAESDDLNDAAGPTATTAASLATTTTGAAGPTTTVNRYIEGYRFDGGVSMVEPFPADSELYEGDDPVCRDAYDGLVEFNNGVADVADVEADLTAIGVTPSADQLRNVQDWQAWKDTYLAGYQTVVDEILASDFSDATTIESLLARPAYVEASDAAADIIGPTESVFTAVVNACG